MAGLRSHFPDEQLLVVLQERLRADPAGTLRRVDEHVGVDPARRTTVSAGGDAAGHAAGVEVPTDDHLRAAFRARVADDTTALRDLLQDDLPEWDVRV